MPPATKVNTVDTSETRRRVVLFLQGAPSAFGRRLADELARRGHRALRINLCIGDWLYWRGWGRGRATLNYRGRLADWEAYLRAVIAREGVTDIVYYVDRLPYHRVAIRVAEQLGLTAVAYELGYLRPDWITFERRGLSAQSHFPDDPGRIRGIASSVAEPDLVLRYPSSFFAEALNDVVFHLANFFLFFVYPFYVPDKVYNRLLEYLSYVPRLLTRRRNARHAQATIERLLDSGCDYFVFTLQTPNDYQIRANSPYRHLAQAVDQVVASFAAHAPAQARLVIKLHPLDNGLEDWARIVARATRRGGVANRVDLIDGGDLARLLRNARGSVLVNSTAGLQALQLGCPVKVLGIATFDVVGLTHAGPLDDFWAKPSPPDPALCEALVRALAGTIQIKGGFFHPQGLTNAVALAAQRLIDGRVNAPAGCVTPPPRLAKARALGIPHVDNDD